MSLVVYNTQSRQKETFTPITPGQVKMYCCGPTVYDLLHVGNFRGAIFYNFVRNWLEHLGYKVTFVYNYTDVDDKIIQRGQQDGVPSEEIAKRYIIEFEKDFNRLGLRKHDINPKVTETMPEIIEMIGELIAKDKAYPTHGDVLYAVRTFLSYGKLSNRQPDELMAGTRVELDAGKRDPLDFALWKGAKPGEPFWKSPWGDGRPGWHIECSAMSRKHLGEQIDIHGGGLDLMFPHHENEIAQSEGCSGKQYAKYWMHNNMLNFGGAKMSKSLGNIRSGRSFMDEFGSEIFKYMMLSVHYRSVSDFSEDSIEQAIKALARIYSALACAESLLPSDTAASVAPDVGFGKLTQEAWTAMETAINDDFNTPEAMARVFEVIRQFNSQVKRGMKPNPAILGKAKAFQDFIKRFGTMLALFQEPPSKFLHELDDMILKKMKIERSAVEALVQERNQVRSAKDFKRSDELRDQLNAMGISVQDLPEGSFWEVTKSIH